MSEVTDPKIIKSKRAKKQLLAMIAEYEDTHTEHENRRMRWLLRKEIRESINRDHREHGGAI